MMKKTSRPVYRADPDDEYFFKEGCYILEISNRPDDPQLSVARARVRPGATTRLHRLHGITERYLILSGTGLAAVGREARQPVGPGDVVVIPPGSAQQITNTGNEDLIFLALCTPRFVPEAYEDMDPGQRT